MAKGARRAKTPFAGKLDLFFEAEISIVPSRKSTLHTLTEVVVRNPFVGIRKNYSRTQAAAYFVELIEICTERDHHEPELFALLRRAFGYLDATIQTSAQSRILKLSSRVSRASTTPGSSKPIRPSRWVICSGDYRSHAHHS